MDSVAHWKGLYEVEHAARLQLEDDCDTLAVANQALLAEIHRLKSLLVTPVCHTLTDTVTAEPAGSRQDQPDPRVATEVQVITEGDARYPNSVQWKIQAACGNKNCLAVAWMPAVQDGSRGLVLCGGVDNALSAYLYNGPNDSETSPVLLFAIPGTAPVLAIDVCGTLVAYSMMDGSLAVVDLHLVATQSCSEPSPASILRFKDHTKYVVAVKWSPCGSFLATVSHDKSANVYSCVRRTTQTDEAPATLLIEKVTTMRFSSTPEAAVFLGLDLVLSLRDSLHLLVVDCRQLSASTDAVPRRVSLNANDWDQHRSFNVLHMAVSPPPNPNTSTNQQSYLACATDNHLVLLFESSQLLSGTTKTTSTGLVRKHVLGGHTAGEYAKPRVCFDISGRYLYVNSDGEHSLYVFSVDSGRLVETLVGGHRGVVKDLCCTTYGATGAAELSQQTSGANRLLLTASFDKTVNVWHRRVDVNITPDAIITADS